MVPDDVAAFGCDVSNRLETLLGNGFVGAYFVGSIALGGYVAGESDVEMIAVGERPIRAELKHEIAEVLLDATRHCPRPGSRIHAEPQRGRGQCTKGCRLRSECERRSAHG